MNSRVKLSDEIEACMRQRCICSKKEIPQFKNPNASNGCTNPLCKGFQRLDWDVGKLRLVANQFKMYMNCVQIA